MSVWVHEAFIFKTVCHHFLPGLMWDCVRGVHSKAFGFEGATLIGTIRTCFETVVGTPPK